MYAHGKKTKKKESSERSPSFFQKERGHQLTIRHYTKQKYSWLCRMERGRDEEQRAGSQHTLDDHLKLRKTEKCI
jgi:hypothetical protein